MKKTFSFILIITCCFIWSCSEDSIEAEVKTEETETETDTNAGADTDTGTDTNTETDTDTGTDNNTDTDAGTDTDTTSSTGLTSYYEGFSGTSQPESITTYTTEDTTTELKASSWSGWDFGTAHTVNISNIYTENVQSSKVETYLILPNLDLTKISEVRIAGDIDSNYLDHQSFSTNGEFTLAYGKECEVGDENCEITSWTVLPELGICTYEEERFDNGSTYTVCYDNERIVNSWWDLYNEDSDFSVVVKVPELVKYLENDPNYRLAIRYTASLRHNSWIGGREISIKEIAAIEKE